MDGTHLPANLASEKKTNRAKMDSRHYAEAVNPYMRYGGGGGDGKNREHRKYECVIPFMRCDSRTACGFVFVFVFCQHHGAIPAAAAGPPQRKVGVVCIPVIFFFFF